jgi:ribonuclease Z
VNANEIPAYSIPSPPPESNPEPIFKDDNITVYAVPVIPLPDVQDASPSSGKRKRSPSPDSPSKRSNVDPMSHSQSSPGPTSAAEPSIVSDDNMVSDPDTPSIAALLRDANFSPGTLTGERAQEWRREVIRTMLSGRNAPNQVKIQSPRVGKGKGKGRVKGKGRDRARQDAEGLDLDGGVHSGKEKSPQKWNSNGPQSVGQNGRERQAFHQMRHMSTDHSQGAEGSPAAPTPQDMGNTPGQSSVANKVIHVSSPKGFNKQLPQFVLPHSEHSKDSRLRPVLAYVVHGPRVRGKFDAKKAEELGIPSGRMRGALTRGEAVTFKVKDGQGGSFERTVRPEDCIGESEVPGVSWLLVRCFTMTN